MNRFPDWATRLEVYLREPREFHYGAWDCCLFVCDAIRVMTGVDPALAFRGKYDSAKAARLLGSVKAVSEAVAARYGMPEVSIRHARRGDVALIKRGRDYSLGLIALDGRRVLVAGARGVLTVPRLLATRAWMV